MTSTIVSRHIAAPPSAAYRAFLDPEALACWLPPGDMRGVVHMLEPREGGLFRMSLIYPQAEAGRGKSAADTDTFTARIAELVPDKRIVWAVQFQSDDASYAGEMRVITTFGPTDGGTSITMVTENIPPGIRPEDNEAGCRSSLEKLAAYLANSE